MPDNTTPPARPRATSVIRGVLFDKDGTLLDFEATWTPVLRRMALEAAEGDPVAAEALLAAGGLDPRSGKFRAGSTIGAGTSEQIVRLWHPTLEGDALVARVVAVEADFHAHGVRESVPVEGLVETLAELDGLGLIMGIATNDATDAAIAAIAAIGLDRYLPHIFGYDAVERAKPAPDQLHAFAAITGLAPAEIVVAGDNTPDLPLARDAGAAAAIGVTSGNSAAHDLAPFADVVLDSIRDLPAWLAQNRK
jgi:phosphoglycolate phosphatase